MDRFPIVRAISGIARNGDTGHEKIEVGAGMTGSLETELNAVAS